VPILNSRQIEIAGIKILLTQKKIKNLHLKICPPNAEVKISAPPYYSIFQIEKFILDKALWIKKSQEKIQKMRDEGKIQMPLKFVSGEQHYLSGEKFKLTVFRNADFNKIGFGEGVVEIWVKGQSKLEERQKLFDDFYREHLIKKIPQLIKKYEEKMGVEVAKFKIRKMKTRWGSCNFVERKICFNSELAKKTPEFLEMIVVHEMVHILEKNHNRRFYSLMDEFMPEWKRWRA
jgi:predicted metal-dependent hydrolase